MEYVGQSANEVWYKAISALVNEAEIQSSRVGDTQELLHIMLTIADPRQRWVTVRNPAINPAFALAEVIWILNGREDSEFLNYWNRQLPKYAGDGECYHGAYGNRLRKAFGFDQLEYAYRALSNNPDSRQINLQIWNPETDFPDKLGQAVADDIPCNLNAMLKVRKGRLEWMQVLRSNDVIRGLPYNIIQFTTLQEVLAGWLNLEVGSYNQLSDSLHIYVADIPHFQWNPSIEVPENTDHLNLPKNISDHAFSELERILEHIIRNSCAEVELMNMIESADVPLAHHNMLRAIGVEEARRRHWCDSMQQLVHNISNPALQHACRAWQAKFVNPISSS